MKGKRSLSYVFFITLFFLFLIGLWIGWQALFASSSFVAIQSPLPDFLSKNKNNQVSTLELFLPDLFPDTPSQSINEKIKAESALVFDITTQKTLYDKNATKRLPMASLTKIMTAILALENYNKEQSFTVPRDALVGEDSMGLSDGETVTLEDLLYGLMLVSGNDAAEVIAAYYPGGREEFIDAMNAKAKALGLLDTHFTNPSGLQGDGVQYTTAYDLMIMTNYALDTYPFFRQVAKTVEHEIPYSQNHKYFYLENETNLLTSYPGVLGVKTGYTPEAGLCLVTYLEYGGHRLIGVLLGSNNRRQEMKDLLDYSLLKLGAAPPKHN